jgi:hypothetical protein
MSGRLGFWVAVTLGLILPAMAANRPATLSGYVRDTSGVPQMGATVEVLGAAALQFRAFTDEKGFFRIADLLPGTYSIKVSAPSFLPTLREQVPLHAGATAVLHLTLNTLFEGLQLGPPGTAQDDEDWKWTMRSAASRPVLRMLPGGTVAVATNGEGNANREMKTSLSFVAGSPSEGYGSTSDVATGFALERPVFGNDVWTMQGTVGYGEGTPSTVLRTGFTHHAANGSEPTAALTFRRFAPPPVGLPTAGLEAIALTTSDNLAVGNILELRFGSELQTIQFMGRMTAFQPFGTADLHLSPDTVVEYAYATSRPSARISGDEPAGAGDVGDAGPRVSIADFSPALERARHQEVSFSHRMGKTNLQVAFFSDQISNTVLTGVGEVDAGNGEVLPDVYSGTFSYQGTDLNTQGLRLVLQRKLRSDLTATLDYGYGGVLDLARQDVELADARRSFTTAKRHAVAGKLSGRVARTKTQWGASYRWTSGQALTPVDLFNASAGQSDPFLSVYIRQPLPGTGFLPVHMEALLDLRNLLAQGYVPVMGQDGRTVYLVQSARSVRGGLAFVF